MEGLYRLGMYALGLLVAGAGLGCQSKPVPVLPRVAESVSPYLAPEGSTNAFDTYIRAAARVETDDQRGLVRVSFTPDQRAASLRRSASAVAIAARGTAQRMVYRFVPVTPLGPRPNVAGWRLIGRVMTWRAEDAGAAANYGRAIDQWAIATKFGMDLTAGSAVEASLGWTIVDDARRAILPYLPRMGAAQLNRLSTVATRLIENRPDPALAFQHEGENHRQAIQALQDAATSGRGEELTARLGTDAESAFRYLKNLATNRPQDLPAYFAGLGQESAQEVAEGQRRVAMPVAQRGAWPAPPTGERPWRRFARLLFTAGRPLLEITDRSLARTRMLALHARALGMVKAQRRAPVTLPGSGDNIVDPYSGLEFRYQAEKADYRLYSVGSDLRDDGGETDPSGMAPDLTLEDVSAR